MPKDKNKDRGWVAKLELEFNNNSNKTFIEKNQHLGPLTAQRPFYPADKTCHLYILHPPGGVAATDELNLIVKTKNNSQVLLTGTGATKFYNSANNNYAVFNQVFDVGGASCLEYLPLENIFFNNAKSIINTTYNLSSDAKIAHWEIFCLGVNNQEFEGGEIKTNLTINIDGKLLILDKLKVDNDYINNMIGLRKYSIFGTFIITSTSDNLVNLLRENTNDEDYICGITKIENIIIIRILANKSNVIMQLFIKLWQLIRPVVFNKEAILPRIWAT
jgi:urease accessory protein